MESKNEKYSLNLIRIIIISLIILIIIACIFSFVLELSKVSLAKFWIVVLSIFTLGVLFEIKLESDIGKYKCKECGHIHKPSYIKVLFSMNLGFKRYLKCPKCSKYSWNEKVLNK